MKCHGIILRLKHGHLFICKRHVEKKLESLQCYRLQIGRKYVNTEYIKGLARTRGVQIGVDFEETFDVLRWIIK
jgi:hypothetical protein